MVFTSRKLTLPHHECVRGSRKKIVNYFISKTSKRGGILTQNQIAFANLQESKRHNVSVENETNRNNLLVSTETNRHNIAYEGETNRRNVVNEVETERSNKARETETHRANVVNALETNRTNVANEAIRQGTLNESIRSNQAHEAYNWQNLSENTRHNKATEQNQRYSNQITAQHYERSDYINAQHYTNMDSETHRSNLARESINWYNANTNAYNAQTNAKNAETNRMNAYTEQYSKQHIVNQGYARQDLEEQKAINQNLYWLTSVQTEDERMRSQRKVNTSQVKLNNAIAKHKGWDTFFSGLSAAGTAAGNASKFQILK